MVTNSEAGIEMNDEEILTKTESVCPVCLKKLDADIVSDGNTSYMEKNCPEHGFFRTIIWKGSISRDKWYRKKEYIKLKNTSIKPSIGCPYDCGLCSDHRQHTCTALIEVTSNCNLHCSFCFADSFSGKGKDPSIEQIKFIYESIFKSSGLCNIQLSGGEPTLRDDLPDIIRIGIEKGFKFIQINTNGIRISEDEHYLKKLKQAGLSSIFLQFDGTNDLIYKKLRGRVLLASKKRAIENCKKYGIGVVLVPTLVPGINIDNIGEIISFAFSNNRAVRGVHFQPVSYFGRIPHIPDDKDRITLPEVIDEIVRQTDGKIKIESMVPPGCENSFCSFHGNYIYMKNRGIINITKNNSCSCKKDTNVSGSEKAKQYVSRNWSPRKKEDTIDNHKKVSDWDEILESINNCSLSISGMAFQDAFNLDIERVKDCCIHVAAPDGRLIPFCLYNLSDINGSYLYRK